MIKFKIKSYIARTIKNFGKLFVFACLLLPSFAICCLLGSWTTDDSDNTYSDDNYFILPYSSTDFNMSEQTFDYSSTQLHWLDFNATKTFSQPFDDVYIKDYEQNYKLFNFSFIQCSVVNSTDAFDFCFNLSDDILSEKLTSEYKYTMSFFVFGETLEDYVFYFNYDKLSTDFSRQFTTFGFDYVYYEGSISTSGNDRFMGSVSNNYWLEPQTNIPFDMCGIRVDIVFTYDTILNSGFYDLFYFGFNNITNSISTSIFVSYPFITTSYDAPLGLSDKYVSNDLYTQIKNDYDNLQNEYDSLEDQANQWYLEKRYYEDAYNQLANTIDNANYSIELLHYNTTDTLSDNFNVVYTINDISDFIVSNSFLDFNALKRFVLSSSNPPIDISQVNGIMIKSSVALSIAQYNLLFNAISSPNYYIGLYYSTNSTSNQFVSYPLRVITDNGASYYFNSYSLYDVLKTQGFDNLFSDFTYDKLSIHLTNNNLQYFTINNIKLNSENGYNTGYSKGLLDSANTIASLQNNVNDLENQKIALNDRIETLQRQLDNNLGWHSLFFSMADTPIKVVSGFLNYEILGINLFKALLGILTALAVLWLIKRFTK